MDTKSSTSKSFKFVGGTKNPRKARPLSCPRKGMFRAHTMKTDPQSSPSEVVKSTKSKVKTSTSVVLKGTTKGPKSNGFIKVDYFSIPDPLNLVLHHGSQTQKLRDFIYSHFSSPSLVLNESWITQLIGMIPTSELKLMDRLLSNALRIPLRYPFESPVYRGPAQDITSIGLNRQSLMSQKMVNINDKLQPLESHLLKLFFKYFNPFYTLVHPNYFEYRLKHDWNHIDFQPLLAIVLCCACSYLAIEPFDIPMNTSQLAEFYFERAQSLFVLIDRTDLSTWPCRIQVLLLSIHMDYNSVPTNYSEASRLAHELRWVSDFTKSRNDILASKPDATDLTCIYHWEENILIWLFLNFHATTVLVAKMPIESFPFETPLPDISPVLDALFDDVDYPGWTRSLEARLVFYLYKGHSIFERVRLYNHKVLSRHGAGCSPTPALAAELNAIKASAAEWKTRLVAFYDRCYFKANELALVTVLHLFYHKTILLSLMPHLPTSADSLSDPTYEKLMTDFLLSATSISLLMACQGIWMVIYAGGTKNFLLAIAWGGVRLCIDHLERATAPEILRDLTTILNPNLIRQLMLNFSFTFQKTLNKTLTQKRSLLFWLNLRADPPLVDLSRGVARPDPKPPKLSNNSKLELLS